MIARDEVRQTVGRSPRTTVRTIAVWLVMMTAISTLAPGTDAPSLGDGLSPIIQLEDVLLPDFKVVDYWEYSTKAWGSGQSQYNSTGTYTSKVEQKGTMNVNGTNIDGYRFSSDSKYYYVSVIQGNLYKSWTNSTGASYSLISTLGSVNASSSTLTTTFYLGNTTTSQSRGYTDYSPPYDYWQFPIKENESWSGTSLANSTTFVNGNRYTSSSPISFTLHSASWEEVTVPAGKFRALRIRTEPTNGYFSLMWYAPGAQTTVRTESYDPSSTMTGVQELTKFSSNPPDRVPPGIVFVVPPGGATWVGLDADVKVKFSESMDKNTAEGALMVTGAVVQSIVWNGNEMTVSLAPLTKATTYQATMAATATDAAGNLLDGDGNGISGDAFSWSFTTSDGETPFPPTVVGVSPLDGATGIPLNARIDIQFDNKMDRASVEAGLTLSPATLGSYSWYAASTSVTFIPTAPLTASQQYIVTLGTTARSESGVALAIAFNSGFTTGTSSDTVRPRVISFKPFDGATDVPLNAGMVIEFSEPMQSTSLLSAIAVSPGVALFAGEDATKITLSPLYPLEPGTTYTISVNDSALDSAGNPLEPASASFTTVRDDEPDGTGGLFGGNLLLFGIGGTIAAILVVVAISILVVRRRRRSPYVEADYYRQIGGPPPSGPGPDGQW